MKKTYKCFLFLIVFIICTSNSYSQGLGVNTSTTPADTSAMLDVSSTTKGVLVPRMNASQRGAISLPATGLIVYQTDGTSGFYYNAGTSAIPSWVILLNGTSGNVTIQGNTFNGANQLVKTDGLGRLPALDGSQLTNISGGSSSSPMQKFDVSSGSTTITLTDLSIRNIVAACNGRNTSGVPFTFIFPSASSYPAGTVLRFSVSENTNVVPTSFQSANSFYSSLSLNKISINSSYATGQNFGNFALMSDGVNTWYRVQ